MSTNSNDNNQDNTHKQDRITLDELMQELFGIPVEDVYVKYYNNKDNVDDEHQQ